MWAQINYFKCKIYSKEENLQNLLGIDGIEFKVKYFREILVLFIFTNDQFVMQFLNTTKDGSK